MISLLWLAVGALAVDDTLSLVPVEPAGGEISAGDPAAVAPIRLWLSNSRQFREGERARVQVETSDDGYLLVFNYDTEGRLRVLYPVDPGDDNLVRAGRRYEIRGRGDRESFIVGRDGQGLVYGAVSADPFRLDEIQAAGNWDYSRLYIGEDSKDPEADLTDLVQRMSTDRGFDYDVLDYRVYGYNNYRVSSGWYPRSYGYWDDYNCDPWYRPSLFGCRYYPTHGWYLGGYYGGRYGWGGYYDDWWWRRRYWGTPIYRNPNYRFPVVAGRPRGYSIVRRTLGSNDARPRVGGGTFTGSLPRGLGTEPGISYRPRDNGRSRPDGDRAGRPSSDAPRGNAPRGVGGDSRPRGRRSPISAAERPNVEREPGAIRGPLDFGDGASRRARGGDERGRTPSYDAPARSERPRIDRPRESSSARAEPRSSPPPRVEARSRSTPRAEPRSSPPSRAEPRHSAPSARPSSGGGGGNRGSGGGSRPRGRPGS